MTIATHPQVSAGETTNGHEPADVLVVFGITGDLAKVMTFRSLYRLEQRGLIDCPIVGVAVDDWTVDDLRRRARESIGAPIDEEVFGRLAERLSYIQGDFGDPGTFGRVASALDGKRAPVFYLEIPPFLFGTVVSGLAAAGLTENARVVVEKPFGHDVASAQALNVEIHSHIDESQLYRIDHFLGKMGLAEIIYLRFANSIFEPIWSREHVACVQITMAEDFGVEDRGHFYDPVGAVRDVVVNHLMQVVGAAAMEPPSSPRALKDALYAVFAAMPAADPAHYVRGQYDGYRDIDGVAADSATETYAAMRLEIDSWRWEGVPFVIRTGKHLPIMQTELRLMFRRPPRLFFQGSRSRAPEPGQLVIRLDPSTGVGCSSRRSPRARQRRAVLDGSRVRAQGGEGPTPYEVLLHAAMLGDSTRFTRQDSVEETWRVLQPLLDNSRPVIRTRRAAGARRRGQARRRYGGWHGPWVGS